MFQSPKTGLCFSHEVEKERTATLQVKFQSPKTGLCFSHIRYHNFAWSQRYCFNPLKRVYAFLTLIQRIHWIWQRLSFNPLKRVYAFLTRNPYHIEGVICDMFQSPKTGLCFSHILSQATQLELKKFQSPKTGLCFSHFFLSNIFQEGKSKSFNPLKRVYAFLTIYNHGHCTRWHIQFQSPKTGLCFSHDKYVLLWKLQERKCFNPLKRVYAFLTWKRSCRSTCRNRKKFQSPKTGLCFSHPILKVLRQTQTQ